VAHIARDVTQHKRSEEALRLAREAADTWTRKTPARPRFALGAMGPGTRTITVTRNVTFEQVRDGYRAQAREALLKRAMEAAEKVRRWGDVVELEPMNAFDRRVIHHALKDDPAVETHSVEVEGTDKKAILLRPKH